MKRARPRRKKVNLGVIGTGWPGEQHARVMTAIPEARLYACADLDPGRRAEPGNNSEQAFELMEMLDAIYASSSLGRKVPIA